MWLVILPLLVVRVQAAFRDQRRAEIHSLADRISPELEHKSDKAFFNKDYPWDKRPVADKYYVFDHPYPAVQDSGDFDRDFVKDENSDGGKWKAQMEYDVLRSKIRKAQEKMQELKEKMEKEYEDWMRAKKGAADGADAVAVAGNSVSKARRDLAEAEKRVNELEGRSQKDGTKVGGAIGDAVKKVQEEMDDLEKCKKNLADAKKRLKELLKEKEEYEKAKKAAKEAEEKAAKEAAEEEARKAKEEAEKTKTEKEAEDKEETKKKSFKKQVDEDALAYDRYEKRWKKNLQKEQKQHAEALKSYEEELKDVKITEDQLARAAENLRKFRRPPYVDDNGGVYNEAEKSRAFSIGASGVMLLAVLMVFIVG